MCQGSGSWWGKCCVPLVGTLSHNLARMLGRNTASAPRTRAARLSYSKGHISFHTSRITVSHNHQSFHLASAVTRQDLLEPVHAAILRLLDIELASCQQLYIQSQLHTYSDRNHGITGDIFSGRSVFVYELHGLLPKLPTT
jgi:hypothetical protein